MQLKGRRFDPTSEPPHLTAGKTAAYVAAILIGLGIFKLLDLGYIRSPFAPPPTPTRMALSYAEEGKAFFDAGILEKAIAAYQKAVAVDPANHQLQAELARIQTYSSELMLSSEKKKQRLEEALASANASLGIVSGGKGPTPTPQNDEFALGHAIKTLVLDWYANPEWMDAETREKTLNQAYQESAKALLLDPANVLALAFRAEVLVDQSNWSAALDAGAQAAQLGPDVMDVHRAYAYVLESNGYYSRAVEEYLRAIDLNTNLPFLYIRLGANYRKLGESATDAATRDAMIDKALEAFARASELNPSDPLPYLSIAQTYSNQGDFFAAERNAEKALTLDKYNPLLYGRLGVIYYKAKNYETAITVLRCAVRGCPAAENEIGKVDLVETLPLAANSVDVYYIYGSVLSFYGDEDGNCEEAAKIFAQLRASPYMDDIIEGIIQEGEVICAAYSRRTPTP
jgi:tetratricopeptide (TPR) repeat protein